MKRLVPGLAASLLCASGAAAATLGSLESPAYSARQILQANPAAADGIYWIDPDGAGGDSPFQVIANMTTAGGGWTLGLQNFEGSGFAMTDMVSNSGTFGLAGAHSRNMTALAIDQTAQIRHRLVEGGVVLFDGYYTGSYHGSFGAAGAWTTLAGDLGVVSYYFGADWSTTANDVDDVAGANCATINDGQPWYYVACASPIPYWTGVAGPYSTAAGGSRLDSYQIFVRELNTPEVSAVPLPAAGLLLLTGIAGAAAVGRRRPA